MDYRLALHRETLGVTHRALKALRDELAKRIDHELLIFQVPSTDGAHREVYGFFLVDKTAAEVIIIGDGFSGDNNGEGGSGHRAALALLAIYGLTPIEMMPEDAIVYRDDASAYRQAVDRALVIAGELHFDVAWGKIPKYIDWQEMAGRYCTYVGKFERGRMFRRHCVRCVHNTAHLGDDKLYCRYLEYRGLPDSKPSIRIPPDLRGDEDA